MDDVFTTILSILHGDLIPPRLDCIFVGFIPKKQKLEFIFEFCPINLCKVMYELVTKLIANHFKTFFNMYYLCHIWTI